MPDTKPWQEIRAKRLAEDPTLAESFEHQQRLADLTQRLYDLRRSRGITQIELAQTLDVTQANISRIEREPDVLLSTLERYVQALGGRLEIHAIFGDEDIKLTA